jgi:hypothetical protein
VSAAPERSLALRVPVEKGEALDSWLEFLARRNGMPTRRLLPALGLPTTAVPARHSLVLGTPAVVLRRIERQTGLPPGRLDDTTLERYQAIGWPASHGSRYCPPCLADGDGHWLLCWRLPWVFGCLNHQLLLSDRCPACRRPPRHYLAGSAGQHPPATCPNLITQGRLCGADLRTVAARPLPPGNRLSGTQRWIDTRLDAVETGDAAAADAATALADLRVLAEWSRSRSREGDYRDFGPAAAHAFACHLGQRPGHQMARHPFTDSLLVGAAATRAVDLLTADTDESLTAELRRLLGQPCDPTPVASRTRRRVVRLGPGKRWRALSSGQRSRLLRAIDPHLAPVDRLRLYSATPHPRMPEDTTAALDRARHIPQLLWPEWTIRLLPTHGFDPDPLRAALATCLLLPGRRDRTFAKTAAELHPHRRCLASVTLRRLLEHGQQDVLVAICHLADYLDQYGSPIDYRRRRILITADVLTDNEWQDLCRVAVAHPGQARRCLDARRYLFALLSGADLNDARHPLAFRGAADRARHLTFTETLSSPLRAALHHHAADHLHQLGIDEPHLGPTRALLRGAQPARPRSRRHRPRPRPRTHRRTPPDAGVRSPPAEHHHRAHSTRPRTHPPTTSTRPSCRASRMATRAARACAAHQGLLRTRVHRRGQAAAGHPGRDRVLPSDPFPLRQGRRHTPDRRHRTQAHRPRLARRTVRTPRSIVPEHRRRTRHDRDDRDRRGPSLRDPGETARHH